MPADALQKRYKNKTKLFGKNNEEGKAKFTSKYRCQQQNTAKRRNNIRFHSINFPIRSRKADLKRPSHVTGKRRKVKPVQEHNFDDDANVFNISGIGETGFECNYCDETFLNKSTLRRHEVYTHSEARPFGCASCGKKFKRKSHLSEHQITHSDDRPLKCALCHRSFKRRSNFRAHQRQHHSGQALVKPEFTEDII